jgi:hypothetical protein
MRRYVLVILILSLLVALVFVQNGNVSSANASPSIYQGDFVLNGNNVTVIEGRFDINGSIVVEENATLILRNAVLNFTQEENGQFNVTFRNSVDGNPRLKVENATIATNNHYFGMFFYENASMTADRMSTDYNLYIRLYMDSLALVSNSAFGYISTYDFSILNVSNSSFGGIYDDDYTKITVSNCSGYIEPEENAKAIVTNSTIALVVESLSVNYSVTEHKPGFVSYWNFQQNCSVVSTLASVTPNVTLIETQVGWWGFSSFGKSNVTVFNSELWGLWGRGSSATSVYNTSISYFLVSDNSAYWHLYNTTTERLYSYGNSVLWLMNSTSNLYEIYDESEVYACWYLDVHVVDSIGQNVPSATVTATYPNATLAESKLTDVNGWARLTLMEKMMNATGDYLVGDYSVQVVYETHSNGTTVAMTGNTQITMVLKNLIVPEFPLLLILPLFMIATLLAVAFYKRKYSKSHSFSNF